MKNFHFMLAFVFYVISVCLNACMTPDEPVHEHYVPPTGETNPANTVDSKAVLQEKPASKPFESSDEGGAEANESSSAGGSGVKVNLTNKCVDAVSGREYSDRDVEFQDCLARADKARRENPKK